MHVIGGGPAGLTAAYELIKRGVGTTVYEAAPIVGGHARTEEHRGYRFDIGGHRFFTKMEPVLEIWDEVLGDRFITVGRMSRIAYNGAFFDYPLRLSNVIGTLGLLESARIALSYLAALIKPYPVEENFEQWTTNRFGDRLYRTFFKTYTEKVWGIPCTEISAEWAAQRIQGLSVRSAVMNALRGGRGNDVKSLIQQFQYPILGPGEMWETMSRQIDAKGGAVHLESEVRALRHDGSRITSLDVAGHDAPVEVEEVIASMPITSLVRRLDPAPPDEILAAVGQLRYRDFLTVCLIVDEAELFPDNWIYVHSPLVHMGRLQNFKNWSAAMVPDSSKTSLGAEYFVSVGDELWEMPDDELVRLAARELDTLGLVSESKVEDGVVYRQPKAYPVYDDSYREPLARVAAYLEGFDNLQTIGRNGLHKYNNQDHSMLTALYAVDILFGLDRDLWAVNSDQQYHECASEGD